MTKQTTDNKSVNGRAKGASFELLIAKLFSKAYDKKFRRTPMSGGWSHGNPQTAGDLVCMNDPEFKFCVECKNAEGWRLESLFTDSHAWFDAWWAQLIKECPPGRTPLLVFSRARQPIFVALRFKDIDIHHTGHNHIVLDLSSEWVVIMTLETFLNRACYDKLAQG